MICYHNIEEVHIADRTIVTIGKFDGLHLGHKALLDAACERRSGNEKTVVLTFDFPNTKRILTEAEMEEILSGQGIDYFISIPVDEDFLKISSECFIQEVLIKKLHIKALFCGEDFRFGYQRKGDTTLLKQVGLEQDFSVTVLPDVLFSGERISSQKIRTLLQNGEIQKVNQMLMRPYEITGKIVHGAFLGHQLGFPTINVHPSERKMLPPNGVYGVRVFISGREYTGCANLGFKPTIFKDKDVPLLEVHLFDTDEDLYDQIAVTRFLDFVRPEIQFSSVEALKKQISLDIEKICI